MTNGKEVRPVSEIKNRIEELKSSPEEPDVYTNIQRRNELLWVLQEIENENPLDIREKPVPSQLSVTSIQTSQIINKVSRIEEMNPDDIHTELYDLKNELRLLKKRLDVAKNVSSYERDSKE